MVWGVILTRRIKITSNDLKKCLRKDDATLDNITTVLYTLR